MRGESDRTERRRAGLCDGWTRLRRKITPNWLFYNTSPENDAYRAHVGELRLIKVTLLNGSKPWNSIRSNHSTHTFNRRYLHGIAWWKYFYSISFSRFPVENHKFIQKLNSLINNKFNTNLKRVTFVNIASSSNNVLATQLDTGMRARLAPNCRTKTPWNRRINHQPAT